MDAPILVLFALIPCMAVKPIFNADDCSIRDKFLRDAESGGNTSASDLVFKGIFKQQKGNLNKVKVVEPQHQ